MTWDSKLCFVAGILLATISLTFSATGLVHLFIGGGWTIVAMAMAFELGKVASTIYLARNFRRSFLSLALATGLLLLSLISSVGVYGYLGRSYNAGQNAAVVGTGTIDALSREVESLRSYRQALLTQVNSIPANQGTNRRKMLAQVQAELRITTERLQAKEDTLSSYQRVQQAKEQDVGELRYAATMLGIEQDRLVMWVITVLAFLLDPLAIVLIFASGIKKPTAVPRVVKDDLPEHLSPALKRAVRGKKAENVKPDLTAVAKLHPRNG